MLTYTEEHWSFTLTHSCVFVFDITVKLLCIRCRYAGVCVDILYIVCVAVNEALDGQAIIIRSLEATSWLLPAISTCLFTMSNTSIV